MCGLVVRLSKQPIQIPCHEETDAKATTPLFVDPIHGRVKLPESIAPYRGGQSASEFMEDFGRILE